MFMVQGGVVRQRVKMYNVHGKAGVVGAWKCTMFMVRGGVCVGVVSVWKYTMFMVHWWGGG